MRKGEFKRGDVFFLTLFANDEEASGPYWESCDFARRKARETWYSVMKDELEGVPLKEEFAGTEEEWGLHVKQSIDFWKGQRAVMDVLRRWRAGEFLDEEVKETEEYLRREGLL